MSSFLFIYLFIYCTGWFKHFDFIERFSSNCNSNSFLERLSIKDLLVDSSVSFLFNSLMWLYVLPISILTILNFLLSRLILTNLHPGSLSILFFIFSYFFSFFFGLYVLSRQFPLLVCDQEGTGQLFCLKWNTVLSFLSLEIISLLLLSFILLQTLLN